MSRFRRLFAVALLLAGAVTTAACGNDDGAPRHGDVRSLAAELDEVADGCQLEYSGLTDVQREVSVCTIGDDTAELSVWTDADAQAHAEAAARDSDSPMVAGPNWTISVSDRATAEQIADATGGELVEDRG